MRMFKRTVAVLALLAIVASCFAVTSFAATAKTYVSEGLVANYNAKGVAKGTTTWNDLSGNGNNITGVPNDNKNYFGNDAYHLDTIQVNFPSAITDCVNGEEFTVELQLGLLNSHTNNFNTFINCPNDWFSLFVRVPGDYIEFKGNTNDRPKVTGGHDYFENSTVAVVFKLGQQTKMYVDGVLIGTGAVSTTKLGANAMFFGHNSYSYETEFKAMRFYNKALTAEQILNNYQVDTAAPAEESSEESKIESSEEASAVESSEEASAVESSEEASAVESSAEESSTEPASFEDELKEKVGEKSPNAAFDIVLSTKLLDKKTVELTASFENETVDLVALLCKIGFDPDKVTLKNKLDEDKVIEFEYDGFSKNWEPDLTHLVGDNLIDFSILNPSDLSDVVNAKKPASVKFVFEIIDGADEIGFWVENGSAAAMTPSFSSVIGNGSYAIVSGEPEESSEEATSEATSETSEETSAPVSSAEPESSESSDPVDTGDRGIIVFAVLAVLAAAGAVTVIKVRK